MNCRYGIEGGNPRHWFQMQARWWWLTDKTSKPSVCISGFKRGFSWSANSWDAYWSCWVLTATMPPIFPYMLDFALHWQYWKRLVYYIAGTEFAILHVVDLLVLKRDAAVAISSQEIWIDQIRLCLFVPLQTDLRKIVSKIKFLMGIGSTSFDLQLSWKYNWCPCESKKYESR